MMNPIIDLLAIACVCFLVLCLRKKTPYLYPPGPKPLPFVGNVFDLHRNSPWEIYYNWASYYGDLLHITIFGRRIIVLNSISAANDLLEKRSRIYSDRPELEMLVMMGWGFNMSFMHSDDPRWRKHRKLFHKGFGPEGALKFQATQEWQSHRFLCDLQDSPSELIRHARNYAVGIIIGTMYGREFVGNSDHLVKVAVKAVDALAEEVFFGAQVLFAFPFLRHIPSWFPGAGFKRFALRNRKLTSALQSVPVELVKKNIAAGTATPSWTSELLDSVASDMNGGITEEDVEAVTATAFAGGFHSVESHVKSFFLAMVMYPGAQQRAQAELDRVLGPNKLPTFSDRASLPYATALCRELLRWHPAVPLGVSHSVTEDDEYRGYFIPKGSAVISNIWAMSRDENVWPQPESFKPERFLREDGKLNDKDSSFVFGFGRRACPGQQVAESTIWIVVACTLAMFNVTAATNAEGCTVEVADEYAKSGLILQPLPFGCSITPRSDETEILVESLRQDALI